MMRFFARSAVVLLSGLWLAAPAAAAENARLVVPLDLQRVIPEAAAVYERETGKKLVAEYYPSFPPPLEKGSPSSQKGVLIAALPEMDKAVQNGLVADGTAKTLFYKRISLGVQKGNPKLIFSPADLKRPQLRLGIMKSGSGYLGRAAEEILGKSAEAAALRENIVLVAERHEDLAEALAGGRIDAAICWDTLENLAPEKVAIMRLAGFKAVRVSAGAIKASAPGIAAELVDFLAGAESAQKIYSGFGYTLTEGGDETGSDSEFYRNFHKHNFYYIYQLLAQQILDDYGIRKGIAVDVGCGGCQMLIHMARLTDLDFVGLDIEPDILAVAEQNVAEAGFSSRFRFAAGDAHNMPLPDDYADLITSRGSMPFWRDRVRVFEEIYRVLKPGGVAFIGGGGSKYLTEAYFRQIKAPWVMRERRQELKIPEFGSLEQIMAQTDIPPERYKIIKSGGNWVEIRK